MDYSTIEGGRVVNFEKNILQAKKIMHTTAAEKTSRTISDLIKSMKHGEKISQLGLEKQTS